MKTFVIKLTFPSGDVLTPLIVKAENEANAREAVEKHPLFETGSRIEIGERPLEEIESRFGNLVGNRVYQPKFTEWAKE